MEKKIRSSSILILANSTSFTETFYIPVVMSKLWIVLSVVAQLFVMALFS